MADTDSLFVAAGEMTEEFMETRNRQASGLPPEGAVDVTTRVSNEAVTVPVSLARSALHKHMAVLSGKIAAEINDPYKFMGNGPYVDQMRAQHQVMVDMAMAEKENARAELDRLGKLTDAEVIQWAVTNGHIGHHANGGLVLV